MNLAPRAMEEWDNESNSHCLSVWVWYVYVQRSIQLIQQEGKSIVSQWQMEPYRCERTNGYFPGWLSPLCLLIETIIVVEETLLSDSPWEHCLQQCLAIKHAYVCQVHSSVSSPGFRQLWALSPLNISGSNGHVCSIFIPHCSLFLLQECLLREFTVASRPNGT